MKVLSERQQFEDWQRSQYTGGTEADKDARLSLKEDGSYKSRSVRGEWLAWQASREYQENNRVKVLCWSVAFKEEYREFDIEEIIPSGDSFRPYYNNEGQKLCWDGEIKDINEEGVMTCIQPTLDKLNSLYGIEVDEISIWEES
ncbi:MAG: hypothetical protein [Caudoviricetes sp.]|nr:MAG: hypothetical protein [Caudoviricetes sp.]